MSKSETRGHQKKAKDFADKLAPDDPVEATRLLNAIRATVVDVNKVGSYTVHTLCCTTELTEDLSTCFLCVVQITCALSHRCGMYHVHITWDIFSPQHGIAVVFGVFYKTSAPLPLLPSFPANKGVPTVVAEVVQRGGVPMRYEIHPSRG